ncbi:MAG TPA: hypothetical protein VE441_04950 [Mycobacterium sp.]|nr:hypothetical protein [Mycobacterium sp.]
MMVFLIGIAIFSVGGITAVRGEKAVGAALMIIGTVLSIWGASQHPGSGCDADGRCQHVVGVGVG